MGPLTGLRIVEFAGIGPGPFCGMLLADMGADVVRIERAAGGTPAKGFDYMNPGRFGVLHRGRRSVVLDLKEPDARDVALKIIARADGLIEGFRPGVMERLGLGPDDCRGVNPRLVFGRMTGWGQDGPLAPRAGHDINYTALSGALHTVGRPGERPVPAPAIVGDMGGGGMLLAFGMVCALLAAKESGEGQVVDAAVCDGSALLTAMLHGFQGAGAWADTPGVNLIDGGPHYYDTYECADGKHVAVGALEPEFYAELMARLGEAPPPQFPPKGWPAAKARLAEVFRTKSRDEWAAVFEGSDACVAPVLGLSEAPAHPHNVARGTFVEIDGVTQPAPAPRLSATPADTPSAPPAPGEHTDAVLAECGYSEEEIASLRAGGVVA